MDDLMKQILTTVADGYDSVRPGAGDCVRKEIEMTYPSDPVFEGSNPHMMCDDREPDPSGSGETVGAPEEVWIRDGDLPRKPHIIDPVSTFPVTGYVKYVNSNLVTELFQQRADLGHKLASTEETVTRLVEALRDLVRQLPTDERLADYNLDQAEAALAPFDSSLINLPERAIGLKEEREDSL